MASNSNPSAPGIGVPLIVAAVILGASVVGASLLLRDSLDRGTTELAALRVAVAARPAAPPAAAPAPPSPEAQAPARPDPNERYKVDTAGAPVRGSKDAAVEIVEFSDFQCPFCSRVTPTLEQIQKEYGDKVRIVWKHLPLSIHPNAPAAHAAAEAAHRQGKFWEMHDRIFANQAEMSPERYRAYAKELGLDLTKFDRDVADPSIQKRIETDQEEAARLLVRGTPAFFVNGRFLSGAQPFAAFKRLIDEELKAG